MMLGLPSRFVVRLAALVTCCVFANGLSSQTEDRPNIVFIMADELGYFELSCMGHPNIRTPNIDRMAREGVRFTQCLAGSSLCAPTRGSLLTGKHTGHTSVRSNGGGTPLRAEEETIGSVLKKAGYATGGFGKWGCGGRGSTGVPEKHGFDTFVGYYDQVHAHTYYPPYIVHNSDEIALAGNRGGREGETYSHYVIVDRAKKFIRANKDRPFFCYMPVTPPHGMFDIPADDPAWMTYKDEDWPVEARRYAAMVTMLDRQVGEVLALLKDLGLAEKTLVMFGGDNGGNDYFKAKDRPRGFHGPNVDPRTGVEFRGKKGNLYEGGLRVPMIAHWPGKIRGGRVSDHLCYFPDLLPTFAELGGTKPPADVDGLSIVPELLGAKTAGREQEQHEYLYWELGRRTAVRMGSWKGVRSSKDGAWELYDLDSDRSEEKDIAAEHPKVVAKLSAFAKAAHEPVRQGSFGDRTLHEKDRRAKGGRGNNRRGRRGGQRRGRRNARGGNRAVENLPTDGLLDRKDWKVVRVSSESTSNGRLARNVLDGDPRTHWHTRFGSDPAFHPHEILIDMGATREVRGIVYLARQDNGWNGAIARCEVFVGDSADFLGKSGPPTAKAELKKRKKAQTIAFAPTRGRFILLRALSEVNDGSWASMAELGALGK